MALLKTNQVAYWKTDESSGTAADAVGLGVYPLTNLNSVSYTTGKINNGAYMGTTKAHNKKLWRADSMGVDLKGAWTVAGWVKGVSASGSATALDIVDWRSTNGTSRYVNMHWVPTGGQISVDVSGTTINLWASSFPTGYWYHYAITCSDVGAVTIYANGVARWSGTRGSSTSGGTDAFALGGSTTSTTNGFPGYFDEWGVWDRELSSQDIMDLQYNGAGLQYDYYTPVTPPDPLCVIALVVAGGGCGGNGSNYGWGAGGGAGGLLYNGNFSMEAGSYPVVVGAAGVYNAGGGTGEHGGNSSISTLIAIGGGHGGHVGSGGASGGSGGGGGYSGNGGGGGTAGQGYGGGTGGVQYVSGFSGGGGGGANGSGGWAGDDSYGGAGLAYSASGVDTWYSSGGSCYASSTFVGGGGGGGYYLSPGLTAKAGIVVIRYPTASYGVCSGGDMYFDDTDTVHIFTTAGTLVLTDPGYPLEVLIVGGGGGGGACGGGGGAGGYLYTTHPTPDSGLHTVVIGAGGVGGLVGTDRGQDGGQSSFHGLVSLGGGGGGGFADSVHAKAGAPGGSGGGGSGYGAVAIGGLGGLGTANRGNDGGDGYGGNSGGGGGAYRSNLSAGQNASSRKGGDGGTSGYKFVITSGTPVVGNTYTNNTHTFTVSAIVSPTVIKTYGTGSPTLSGTLVLVGGTGGNCPYTSFTTLLYGGNVSAILTTNGTNAAYQTDDTVGTVGSLFITNTFSEEFHGPASLVTFKVRNHLLNPALVYTAYLYDITAAAFYSMRAVGTNSNYSIAATLGSQTLQWDLSRAVPLGGPYVFDTIFNLDGGHTYTFVLLSDGSPDFTCYGSAAPSPYFTMTMSHYAGGGGGGGRTMLNPAYNGGPGIQYTSVGGGTSGSATNIRPDNGIQSTGGGGGGGGFYEGTPVPWGEGGNGGSGIVIIRYLTSAIGTSSGGTKTVEGLYTVHTFVGPNGNGGTDTFSYQSEPVPPEPGNDCTDFTYTDWSDCVDGEQTREVVTEGPVGCVGGYPILTRTCPPPPPEFLYLGVGVDPADPLVGYDLALTEHITINLDGGILPGVSNLVDSLNISTDLAQYQYYSFLTSDTLNVSEYLNLLHFTPIPPVSDLLQITEDITIENKFCYGETFSLIDLSEVIFTTGQLGDINIVNTLNLSEQTDELVFFPAVANQLLLTTELILVTNEFCFGSTSDLLNLSEVVVTSGQLGDINVSETIQTTEFIDKLVFFPVVAGDDLNISENLVIETLLPDLSLVDSIVLTEDLNPHSIFSPNVYDTIVISEYQAVTPPLFDFDIWIAELLILTETSGAHKAFSPEMDDLIELSENISITPPIMGYEIFIIQDIYLYEEPVQMVQFYEFMVIDLIRISEVITSEAYLFTAGRMPIGDKGMSL